MSGLSKNMWWFWHFGCKGTCKIIHGRFVRIRYGSAPSPLPALVLGSRLLTMTLKLGLEVRQGAPSLRKSCQVTQNNCSPHITSCPPVSEQETSQRQGKCKSKSKDKGRQADRRYLSTKFCNHRFWGKKLRHPTYIKRILHLVSVKNITYKSSYNWLQIDILRLLRPLTAIFSHVQNHLNYYTHIK